MSGKAMFTIVASTKATAAPSDAIASTVCGEGLHRILVSSPIGSAALSASSASRAAPVPAQHAAAPGSQPYDWLPVMFSKDRRPS
jgi:hypothetical protein